MNNLKQKDTTKFAAFVNIQNMPEVGSIGKMIFDNNKEAIMQLVKQSNNILDLINSRDNTEDSYSWTPLYWGVKLQRKEIISILLQHGADINQVVNDTTECCGTALDLATLRGDLEIIELLESFAESKDISTSLQYQNMRTKPKGREKRVFNYDYYSKKNLSTMGTPSAK